MSNEKKRAQRDESETNSKRSRLLGPATIRDSLHSMVKYSFGDLLMRALRPDTTKAVELPQTWDEFITMMMDETGCPVSYLEEFVLNIDRYIPFIGVDGIIDPQAVYEVLHDGGGKCHFDKSSYNPKTDPRRLKEDHPLRLRRNTKFLQQVATPGALPTTGLRPFAAMFKEHVPISEDWPFIRSMIKSAGYQGDHFRCVPEILGAMQTRLNGHYDGPPTSLMKFLNQHFVEFDADNGLSKFLSYKKQEREDGYQGMNFESLRKKQKDQDASFAAKEKERLARWNEGGRSLGVPSDSASGTDNGTAANAPTSQTNGVSHHVGKINPDNGTSTTNNTENEEGTLPEDFASTEKTRVGAPTMLRPRTEYAFALVIDTLKREHGWETDVLPAQVVKPIVAAVWPPAAKGQAGTYVVSLSKGRGGLEDMGIIPGTDQKVYRRKEREGTVEPDFKLSAEEAMTIIKNAFPGGHDEIREFEKKLKGQAPPVNDPPDPEDSGASGGSSEAIVPPELVLARAVNAMDEEQKLVFLERYFSDELETAVKNAALDMIDKRIKDGELVRAEDVKPAEVVTAGEPEPAAPDYANMSRDERLVHVETHFKQELDAYAQVHAEDLYAARVKKAVTDAEAAENAAATEIAALEEEARKIPSEIEELTRRLAELQARQGQVPDAIMVQRKKQDEAATKLVLMKYISP